MIKVLIHRADVRVINYTNKTTGQPAQLRAQEGYAFTVNAQGEPAPFPEKFEFLLDKDQPAYAAGEYQLHPSAFFVDRNNRLALSVRLAPVKKPAASAAA
ncbi:heavy metal transporter [Aquabacterium fontiphilum]|uniref:single-stranded DNA-binding protein n=1 Tax=Aquabacterium fontiphilum TaxID=450365 RepID=UPI00137795F1|nr:single-stranded DNA-binding protein [Aquabacterium fontiphilum]NBD21959.1 heavy metal transporter [Aquabacterium fontiphilum]